MTAAVCLHCGKMKTGAWTSCPSCHHLPNSLEDRAKHLITTDHYLKREMLEAISQNIQAGQPAQFVDTQVQAVMAELEHIENSPEEQRRRRLFKRLPWLLIGALIFGAATILWLKMRSS